MTNATVSILDDRDTVAQAAATALVTRIVEIQARGEEVQLALTGGTLGSLLWAAVADLADPEVNWSQVRVWWGDERWLPAGDPDRNDVQNDAAGLARLGLDPAKVHRVSGPDLVASPEIAAAQYSQTLRDHGKHRFDVAICGVGPDGHVASLFPHHQAQRVTDEIAVAVHDSPKPPPTRVSLTFASFERADAVWLIVSGADKAKAVADGVAGVADAWDVPCAHVHGTLETHWFLDRAAAADLT